MFRLKHFLTLAVSLLYHVNLVTAWDRETFAYKQQCVQANASPNSTTIPRSYGMLLFPAYELIDVFGPLEALQMLSRMYRLDLALISATLDPVTTQPRSAGMNPFNSSFFPQVLPTHTIASASKNLNLDVLIIPGGLGTRAPDLDEYLTYLRNVFPKLKYLVTVCTGALLAGKAGLLDGRRVTTNKASWSTVVAAAPKAKWQPQARWVVDGNLWSSSGISAGIDVTLEFVECLYGEGVATTISNGMEYDRHTDPRWDPFARIFNVTA